MSREPKDPTRNRVVDTAAEFSFDVRRTLTLYPFMSAWGGVRERVRFVRRDDGSLLEVYLFDLPETQSFVRVASVGASPLPGPGGVGFELLFVLPRDLGGATLEMVGRAIVSVVQLVGAVRPVDGGVLRGVELPQMWARRCLVVDQPRGEDPDLECIAVADRHVHLLWLLPLSWREAAFVEKQGLDSLDEIVRAGDLSFVDVNRSETKL